jgi:PPOX class probable F420-dependent enzyme
MDMGLARHRVSQARVGRLGTVTPDGRPHLVPCCFAVDELTAYTAVDSKPKSTLALRRLENIAVNGSACLLVDHYEEDWSELWWIRLDGTGRLVDSAAEAERSKEALVAKYPQYRTLQIPGPVIALEIKSWRSWP